MEEQYFWNDFDLKKPPMVTVTVTSTAFAKVVYVAINNYLQHQTSSTEAKDYAEAAALLARLKARRNNSFRGMIGFRSVSKLNSALCRLLRVDLQRDLETFRGALPDLHDDGLSGDMPTRNSLEYVLVRLLSVHHIYLRIQECCKQAADYFGKMLRSAFFVEYLTLLLGNIAKLNSLSEALNARVSKLYNKLLPYREHFPIIAKHKFLPDEIEFPSKLEFSRKQNNSNSKSTEELEVKILPKPKNAPKKAFQVDFGNTIARETKVATQKQAFNVEQQLASVEDIKKFINNENKARQQQQHKHTNCITKSILKHEWLAAQKLFERKLQAGEQKKAINIFRKFISNKL